MFFRKIGILYWGVVMALSGSVCFGQTTDGQLLQKAEEAFNAQRWKSAGTLYELLLKDSVSYTPYMAKALMANELDGDDVSVRRADELFMRNRFRMDSLLNDFSRMCIRMKHFDVFEESLERMRRVMPENADTLLYGMIKYRLFLREPQNAIRLAQLGMKESPSKNMQWWRLEASGWQMLGKSEKALPLYEQLLKKNPNDLDALLFEGNFYFLSGKAMLKKLDEEYQQHPAITRMQYATYRNGVQDILNEYFVRATELLEKANEINPNATVANTLYEMYVLKSEVDKANKIKKSFRK